MKKSVSEDIKPKENKRYCDMNKLAQSICENMDLTEDEANMFIFLLWQQSPVDVVEVVRCKDCGNYCKNTGECNMFGHHPGKYGYCSSNTKREGETNEH